MEGGFGHWLKFSQNVIWLCWKEKFEVFSQGAVKWRFGCIFPWGGWVSVKFTQGVVNWSFPRGGWVSGW